MMKKLLLSFAMLAAIFVVKGAEPKDISDQYLQNYTAPFETTGESVLNGNDRWQKLASPWVTENNYVDEDGNVTGWHVDFQKFYGNAPGLAADNTRKGVMTITPGWDGFSKDVTNAKVYQTVTLPAGQYEFVAQRAQDWSGASGAYLVAAKGAGIPDISNLDNALGSFHFPDATEAGSWLLTVSFKLEEETEVSFGAVATYTDAQLCVTLGEFWLYEIEGANFRILDALIVAAQKYKSTNYPIGTFQGTYPQAKWDAFVAALVAAGDFRAATTEETTQEEVDVQYDALKTAMDELNGSLVLPFKVSDDTQTYWYQIRDKRATPTYWTTGEFTLPGDDDEGIFFPMALSITQDPESVDNPDQMLFKIVKAPAPAKGYYIYNKEFEDFPLAADRDNGTVIVDFEGELEETTWLFGKTSSQIHYNVFDELKNGQLNSFVTHDPQRMGFYNVSEDLGNMWQFLLHAEDGITDYTDLIALYFDAFKMTDADYPTGSGESQYDADKWAAFVTARTLTLTMLERSTTNDEPSQEEVDAMFDTLANAIQELKDSQSAPFFVSNETDEYWYLVLDARPTKSVWKLGEQDEEYEDVRNQLIMIKGVPDSENITDSLLFKFEKEEGFNGYFIYNKVSPELPLVGDEGDGFIGLDMFLDPATWILTGGNTSYPGYFLMAIENEEGEAGKQVNSFAGYSPPYISFYDGGWGDAGNRWQFKPANTTSVKDVKPTEFRIFVVNRTILTENPADKLIVYSVNGQLVDAKRQLSQGVYIVRIEGKAGAAKIIVR